MKKFRDGIIFLLFLFIGINCFAGVLEEKNTGTEFPIKIINDIEYVPVKNLILIDKMAREIQNGESSFIITTKDSNFLLFENNFILKEKDKQSVLKYKPIKLDNVFYMYVGDLADILRIGYEVKDEKVYFNKSYESAVSIIPYTTSKERIQKLEKLPVLMYHMFKDDAKELNNGAIITPAKFKEDMLILKANGYNSILPWELEKYLNEGWTLPANPVLITIDDGYEDNYEKAFPILKETEMKASIFIVGWCRGTDKTPEGKKINPHFDWKKAKEMYKSGLVSIQPHSFNMHWDAVQGINGKGVLPFEGEELNKYRLRFTEDLKKNTNDIVNFVGDKPLIYSYPFGAYNDITEEVLRNNGFIGTLTVKPGVSQIINNNLFKLNRINVTEELKGDLLLKSLN